MNDIMYSNQDSALLIIEEIEQLCEDDSLAYFHSWANFNRAVIYGIRGNYTQAIEFNLYALDGYSHNEIADMLGISAGTSKSNLARARMILKTKILAYNKNSSAEGY